MKSGAQVLVESLESAGTRHIFGFPGLGLMSVYRELQSSSITSVVARHEQDAGHMAEGYAQASGLPGVVLISGGAAATNAITPLCDALMDSVPLVCISTHAPYEQAGFDTAGDCDLFGLSASVTKHSLFPSSVEEIVDAIAEAFFLASTGRPGPVLVGIPTDVLMAKVSNVPTWPTASGIAEHLPGFTVPPPADPSAIRAAAELMLTAVRPILYVGGGVRRARASWALKELAELTQTHVVTTLMARGALPDDHELALGMPGMYGNYTAITAMQESDLLVALGARFDDRVTGALGSFAPTAKVIHADIDPSEVGKLRKPDVALIGDCRDTIEALVREIRTRLADDEVFFPDRSRWRSRISGMQEKFPLTYEEHDAEFGLRPQYVVERLREMSPSDSIVTSGVGLHQMWASHFWRFSEPHKWINSGGLGTMGFSIPAAIGAKAAFPDATVWAIDGDGCFQMTGRTLSVASSHGYNVKVAVLNNSYLGMVRQFQEMLYDKRFSQVHLSNEVPNYVKWAEAMGCVGIRVDDPDEIDAAIEKANAIDDRPVVLDFRTDEREIVLPMVPGGRTNWDVEVPASQRGDLARERDGRQAP